MKIKTLNLPPLAAMLSAALFAASLAIAAPAYAQKAFPTPEAAADALIDGIARHDPDAVTTVLGADHKRLIPMDDATAEDRTSFLAAWARSHKVVTTGDKAVVEVGTHGWTMPIPLVKTGAGWSFDTKAAAEEMRIRRIGRNELATIQVVLAYVDAQREYAARDWDGDGARSYAMKSLSSPGKRDGLYWASLPDEPESPLGPAFADARPGQPYHGYAFRILTAQGPSAQGGAKSFVKNGRMSEGFALIAWPAKYDYTGVMTFIVNQDGVVYEKDLGPNTATAAAAIKSFNPDSSWQRATLPKR
jgi:hypothetical protein